MELRHLEYFVAVADEQSFSRAAKRLRMAQPPLSIQIKALETELGTKLFDRLSRGVSLTPVGKIFLRDAQCILKRAQMAKDNLKRANSGIVGRIAIGIVPTIINEQLATFLQEFRLRHPHVELDIHEMHSAHQITALLEDQLDLGFMRTPAHEPEIEDMFITEEPMILAVPSNNPLARLRRVDWKLLDGQPTVLLDLPYASSFNNQFISCCQEAGATPVINQSSHSVHMNMWLVSVGFGIAPATHSMRHIIRPNLTFCDLPANAPRLQTVTAWKKSNTSPVLRNMVKLIREILERTPPSVSP